MNIHELPLFLCENQGTTYESLYSLCTVYICRCTHHMNTRDSYDNCGLDKFDDTSTTWLQKYGHTHGSQLLVDICSMSSGNVLKFGDSWFQ